MESLAFKEDISFSSDSNGRALLLIALRLSTAFLSSSPLNKNKIYDMDLIMKELQIIIIDNSMLIVDKDHRKVLPSR